MLENTLTGRRRGRRVWLDERTHADDESVMAVEVQYNTWIDGRWQTRWRFATADEVPETFLGVPENNN